MNHPDGPEQRTADLEERIAEREACDEDEGDEPVSACDVCDTRPGNHTVIAYGTETWVCDVCSGVEP